MNNIKKIKLIARLAIDISMAGEAHVFVRYSGHVHHLSVSVSPFTQRYNEGDDHEYLLDEYVFLKKINSEETTKALDNIVSFLLHMYAASEASQETKVISAKLDGVEKTLNSLRENYAHHF